MDKYRLASLRERLRTAEAAFEVRMFKPPDIRLIVADLLDEFPDMPDEELERIEMLKLAACETKGLVL
jgi:hypothetical protein